MTFDRDVALPRGSGAHGFDGLDRNVAPRVTPFGHLDMPADIVELLPNGITLHRAVGGTQPVCTVTILISGGMAELGDAVARLMVSQLSDGSEHYDAEAFADEMDFYGVRQSARVDSHYIVVEASMLSERLPDALPVVLDAILYPAFPADRLEVHKARLCEVLKMAANDPAVFVDDKMRPLVMGAYHPLAQVLTPELVMEVSTEQLRRAHRRVMNPAAFNVYLSGRVSEDALDALRACLGNLTCPDSEPIALDIRPFDYNATGTVHTYVMANKQLNQAGIKMTLPAPDRAHPDYVPLRYAVMALGGYFGSRLMSNIREEKGLTYGISASLIGYRDGSYVEISTLTDFSYTEQVIEEIKAELVNLATNPPRGDEFDRLHRHAGTALAELLDNPTSVMSYYAGRLLVGSPDGYFDRQQEVLAALTPELISAIAARYLSPSRLTIVHTVR
ncbi:MAG: insulinase family protein [Muribaculaceae bacterium]|nr:insulinase family protein [Muribaculaceae bacterium]